MSGIIWWTNWIRSDEFHVVRFVEMAKAGIERDLRQTVRSPLWSAGPDFISRRCCMILILRKQDSDRCIPQAALEALRRNTAGIIVLHDMLKAGRSGMPQRRSTRITVKRVIRALEYLP